MTPPLSILSYAYPVTSTSNGAGSTSFSDLALTPEELNGAEQEYEAGNFGAVQEYDAGNFGAEQEYEAGNDVSFLCQSFAGMSVL